MGKRNPPFLPRALSCRTGKNEGGTALRRRPPFQHSYGISDVNGQWWRNWQTAHHENIDVKKIPAFTKVTITIPSILHALYLILQAGFNL